MLLETAGLAFLKDTILDHTILDHTVLPCGLRGNRVRKAAGLVFLKDTILAGRAVRSRLLFTEIDIERQECGQCVVVFNVPSVGFLDCLVHVAQLEIELFRELVAQRRAYPVLVKQVETYIGAEVDENLIIDGGE